MPDEGPLREDLTATQLQKGYWYVTHIVAIKKGIVTVSIGIVSLIWLSALVSFVFLYGTQLSPYRLILNELKESVAHEPPPSLVEGLIQFPMSLLSRQTVDATLYNLFLEIENKNTSYRADFEGVFVASSGKTYVVKEFLMPGEKKYVFAFSLREDPGAALFEVRTISWTHLSKKVLSEVAQKSNFTITSQVPLVVLPPPPGGRDTIRKTMFTFINNSGYGYREIRLPIVLKYATERVAVQQVVLQNVKPGESRVVEVRWVGDITSADEVDVRPNVDSMDPQAFFLQPAGVQRHFNSENQLR